jgi:hypothetical protein
VQVNYQLGSLIMAPGWHDTAAPDPIHAAGPACSVVCVLCDKRAILRTIWWLQRIYSVARLHGCMITRSTAGRIASHRPGIKTALPMAATDWPPVVLIT